MAFWPLDRTRQNHGIEHGTVTVLLEQGVRPPIAGLATPWGFVIYAGVPVEKIQSAVAEALGGLQEGNRELAVSPFCGTNLLVGFLIAGLATALIMRKREGQLRRLLMVAGAIALSTVLRRPIGNELQRRFTTLADVDNVEIANVRCLWGALHWVRTARTRGASL